MWFVLYAFVLARLWIISFFWSPFHIFFAVSLGYGLFYAFRQSHRDGTLQIHWVRGWGIWDWIRRRYFAHAWHQGSGWLNFNRRGEAYLFVVHPRLYGVAPIISFALHGKAPEAIAKLAPLVAAPPFFFRVPVLCDLLQAMGCITETSDAMENAIYRNTSVVWSPIEGRQGDVENQADPVSEETRQWLASLAGSMPHRFNIVPVHVTGEERAYYDATPAALSSHRVQGYRFPSVLFGLFGGPLPRRCQIRVFVGEPIPSTTSLFDGTGAVVGSTSKGEAEIGVQLGDALRNLIAAGRAVQPLPPPSSQRGVAK